MESKMEESRYSLITELVEPRELTENICDTYDFTEFYLVNIDKFENPKCKQIMIKQLLIMSFACLEGFVKGFFRKINSLCDKNCKDEKTCQYYTPEKEMKKVMFNKLERLINMRLICINNDTQDRIYLFNELRNKVHLSDEIEDIKNEEFNEGNIDGILDLFIEIVEQISLLQEFFNKEGFCLKELDEDNFNANNVNSDRQMYIQMKFDEILYAIMENSKAQNYRLIVPYLREMNKDTINEIVRSFSQKFFWSLRCYKTDDEKKDRLKAFLNGLKSKVNTKEKKVNNNLDCLCEKLNKRISLMIEKHTKYY